MSSSDVALRAEIFPGQSAGKNIIESLEQPPSLYPHTLLNHSTSDRSYDITNCEGS